MTGLPGLHGKHGREGPIGISGEKGDKGLPGLSGSPGKNEIPNIFHIQLKFVTNNFCYFLSIFQVSEVFLARSV